MIRIQLLKFTTFALVLLSCVTSWAQFYDKRPEVLKVSAKDNSKSTGLSENWAKAQYGHFVLLAQTLTFFPDAEYFFLARDIEYLYDTAQVLLKDNVVLKKRLHLVPVSTNLSYKTDEMVHYLKQEGLNKKNLGQRTAVFIDSCCTGSVPDRIAGAFSKTNIKIKGYLIQTAKYPKSGLAETLGANGGEIENLPHYTSSASEYDGTGKAIRIRAALAGEAERNNSRRIMEQIRFDYDNSKSRTDLVELVALMQTAYSYLVKDSPYKGATREQAVQALKKMSMKFKIPASVFIQDIDSMKRLKYAAVNSQRTKSFLKPTSEIYTNDVEALTLEVMKDPEGLADLKEKVSKGFTFDQIIQKAITRLGSSDPEDLDLSKTEHETLSLKWMDAINSDNRDFETGSPEMVTAIFKLILKSKGSRDAVVDLVESLPEGNYDAKTVLLRKKLIIEALMNENYAYDKKSALYFLINKSNFFAEHMDVFNSVLNSFVKNANAPEVLKATEDLLKHSNDFVANGAEGLENRAIFAGVLTSAIDALPTISRSLAKSYLDSGLVDLATDQKALAKFGKWFFSQREYFEGDALKLPVSKGAAASLTNGKFGVSAKGTTVSELSNYFLPKSAGGGRKCALAHRRN